MSDSDLDNLVSKLNADLEKLDIWFKVNKLSINLKKTKFMIFTNKKYLLKPKIEINSCEIEQVSDLKFLGVVLDDKLNWKSHIAYVSNKLAKSIGILYKVRYILSSELRKILYSAFVTPHIAYCNIVWGSTYRSNLKALMILQKKAVKLALGLPLLYPSVQLFHTASILSFSNINLLQVSMFMYRFHNDMLPSFFKRFFTYNYDIHQHNLRNLHNFALPPTRTNYMKFSIQYHGPIVWNALPKKLKSLNSIQMFKSRCKKYLMEENLELNFNDYDGV